MARGCNLEMEKIIAGVKEGCCHSIKEAVGEATHQTERGVLKSYDFAKQNAKESHEFAKQNAKEMKKALANCYHEVVKGNKRMESSEGTLKELIQGQAATNKLILDLAAKFDAFQEEKQPYKTNPRPAHRAYCTFCRKSGHDLGECEERVQCYRCGAGNHREDNCYWRDRLCNKCNVKGHKQDMHEVEDAKLRAKLISSFPNVFLHFLGGSVSPTGRGVRDGVRGSGADRGRF